MYSAPVVAFAFSGFAVLHSLTVSRWFKRLVAGMAGETFMRAYYRLVFTVFSGIITLAAAYVVYIQPDITYWHPAWYIALPMRAVQLGGVALALLAARPLDMGLFTGIRQAREHIKTGRTGGDIEGMAVGPLVTSGAYGLVRHPMYLGGAVIFLFEPYITEKTLILRLFAAAYFAWGGLIEERRFTEDFGAAYLEYKGRVPMFNILKGFKPHARG